MTRLPVLGQARGAMTLEHDRREQLDPVGHELAVARFAQLAHVAVDRRPRRSLPRRQSGALVGRACADLNERAGDAARHKLVLASRLRTLTASDLALARLAALAPCLLARKKLGKDVRPTAVHEEAPIALASMPRAPVGRVQVHPRARVLRPRRRCLRCASLRRPAPPSWRTGA
jgi:hypothetical protein